MEFHISEAGQCEEYLDGALNWRLKGNLLICLCLESNVACQNHEERKSEGPKVVGTSFRETVW